MTTKEIIKLGVGEFSVMVLGKNRKLVNIHKPSNIGGIMSTIDEYLDGDTYKYYFLDLKSRGKYIKVNFHFMGLIFESKIHIEHIKLLNE